MSSEGNDLVSLETVFHALAHHGFIGNLDLPVEQGAQMLFHIGAQSKIL